MIAFEKEDLEKFVAWSLAAGRSSDGGDPQASKTFNEGFPYPFYSPSLFIRIGLFVLTLFIVLLVFGLLWLLAGMPSSDTVFAVLSFLVCTMCVGSAEYFSRKKKHYQSGIDEGLQLAGVVLATAGFSMLMHLPSWATALIAGLFSLLFFLRFINVLLAGIFVLCCFVFLAEFSGTVFPAFVYSLPLMLIAAGGYYFLMSQLKAIPVFYADGIKICRYCLLGCVVFFGNYVCVAEPGDFFAVNPFAAFVYKVTTVAIPLVLLYYGVVKKDIVALHVSMVAVGYAVYSVFEFANATHPFVWMAVGGLMLIIISALLMKWLKVPRGGFVYKRIGNEKAREWIEILAAANAPAAEASAATEFGGGDFGGGGASSSF